MKLKFPSMARVGTPVHRLVAASACCAFAWASLSAAQSQTSSPADVAFEQLWSAVQGDPYDQLPHYAVDAKLFGPSGSHERNRLRQDARRTLTSDADLVDFPSAQKLFQANGICFAATWKIDDASPYSGVFAASASHPAIVRISVMLGDLTRGSRRTVGMAVKLFVDQANSNIARTVSVLVMDAISGSRRPYVLDAPLDNHPDYGGLPSMGVIGRALRIRADLGAVDDAISPAGANIRYRDLTRAAGVNQEAQAAINAPHWIRLSIDPATPRVDAEDFREELALNHYPDSLLRYDIELADATARGKAHADWRRSGSLILRESVVSATCDQRLHFAHPPLQHQP